MAPVTLDQQIFMSGVLAFLWTTCSYRSRGGPSPSHCRRT